MTATNSNLLFMPQLYNKVDDLTFSKTLLL